MPNDMLGDSLNIGYHGKPSILPAIQPDSVQSLTPKICELMGQFNHISKTVRFSWSRSSESCWRNRDSIRRNRLHSSKCCSICNKARIYNNPWNHRRYSNPNSARPTCSCSIKDCEQDRQRLCGRNRSRNRLFSYSDRQKPCIKWHRIRNFWFWRSRTRNVWFD